MKPTTELHATDVELFHVKERLGDVKIFIRELEDAIARGDLRRTAEATCYLLTEASNLNTEVVTLLLRKNK